MPVEHGIEGEPICPAGGEVEDVDLTVRPRGLAHPAQQDLLTIRLLQGWHDILHDIFHLFQMKQRLPITSRSNENQVPE